MSSRGITKTTGRLSVNVHSDSVHFGYNVPVEIRDSQMRLVDRAETTRQFDLDPGFYEVSAVLEDGRDHAELVEIKGGDESFVELGASPEMPTESSPAATSSMYSIEPSSRFQRLKRERKASLQIEREPVEVELEFDAELLNVKGAEIVDSESGYWTFKSLTSIDSVPTARFRLGEEQSTICLPTSPHDHEGFNACNVRLGYSGARLRVVAWISGDRIVANALMNMLASSQLKHAAHMAERAVELLRQKYSDPTGAALGALILHKVGRLHEYESWVRNLANDFEWMLDGKIFLASLLFEKRENMEEVRQLAIDASARRPLYTDSYSILLDILRRWPKEARSEELLNARNRIALYSPYVDWDSICFSVTDSE